MYYSNADIDELEKTIGNRGGEAFIRRVVLSVGKLLEKKRSIYKTFGVYWWAMKEALRKYYPVRTAWFMGGYQDMLMYERSWHGSLFRTVLAAANYHKGQISVTAYHEYTGRNGESCNYTLQDEDAEA
jgi:phosphopantetheinyl transferase (holo-ACP synthase)